MQLLQEEQCKKLLEYLSATPNADRTLVEIGCGDGSFLEHATRYFESVVGIEPSKVFAHTSLNKGFKVFNDYVTEFHSLPIQGKSAFVSRQVFEHLPDPLDCLMGIRKMLAPGAVGLIEVPNGYKAFRNGNFYEFFPDHVNYYSVNSLVTLANTAGFNVISCNESFGGDYLELWIRNDISQNTWVTHMNARTEKILDEIRNWILTDQSMSRSIFGSGAKTLSIIAKDAKFFSENIRYIIDSDPNKQGRFVPNTSIEVVSIDQLTHSQTDQVLILALSYTKEITALIQKHISSDLEVFTIDPEGKLSQVV
jgi:SAM-dependent methyltransferase